jgi:hypothetical protein
MERLSKHFPLLLAIDPSINNLGFAIYDMGKGKDQYNLDSGAWTYGLINPKGKYLQHRWRDAYRQLVDHWLEGRMITHLVSEWPTFFKSEKGLIAAQEGYTIEIASIVAYLAGRLNVKADYISMFTPQRWKGSVPKHVTEGKFKRLFGEGASKALRRGISNDVVDAIMIGEYWLSLYNQNKFSWQHQHVLTSI